MQTKYYIDSIETKLSLLVTRVKLRGELNLLDLHVIAENFFRDLLNLIYGYNLRNMNYLNSNIKGIDLIDQNSKVIFQVTSTQTTDKINKSIIKLEEKYQDYNLKFVIIVDSIPKLFSKSKPFDNGYISFDPKKDILDVSSLLKAIVDCDIKKLKAIYDFLEDQIPFEVFQNKFLKETGNRHKMLSKALWNHETTNDNKYVKRSRVLKWFSKNVDDLKVRTISIRGIGGTGKTSMIGYWAKVDQTVIDRPLEGLFYWSFYVERDCDDFINALLDYFENMFDFDFEEDRDELSPIECFIKSISLLPPVVVILDGLEVLQEEQGSSAGYGNIINAVLRDFIIYITSAKKPWLCVTTSRFPLNDIRNRLTVEEKQIYGVEDDEGAEILHNQGVNGSVEDRVSISNYLEGHPLGIRVFAASFNSIRDRDYPLTHFNKLFEGLNSNELAEKLDKIFVFYRLNSSELQINSLSALSIFRKGISLNTWVVVCKKLIDIQSSVKKEISDFDIKVSIKELQEIGLVTKDIVHSKEMYACHPVVRDFFNNSYLADEPVSGKIIANFLTNSPDAIEINGIEAIERFVTAIEVLLTIREEQSALEIYIQRLNRGKIFVNLGLPKEAKSIYRKFYDFYVPQDRKRTSIGDYRNGHLDIVKDFINPYVEYCIQLGEFREAEVALDFSELRRMSANSLRWRARIKFQKGIYQESISLIERAIEMDKPKLNQNNSTIESQIISSFLLFKIHYIINEDIDKIIISINKLIQLSVAGKYADIKIISPLCKLLKSTRSRNKRYIKKYAQEVEKDLNSITNWYFKLEVELYLAEAYVVVEDYKKAFRYINNVYDNSVKESYPYIQYQSSLIRAKALYLNNANGFNIELVEHILQKSKSDEMPLISLKAVELMLEIKGYDEELEEQKESYKNILKIF